MTIRASRAVAAVISSIAGPMRPAQPLASFLTIATGTTGHVRQIGAGGDAIHHSIKRHARQVVQLEARRRAVEVSGGGGAGGEYACRLVEQTRAAWSRPPR